MKEHFPEKLADYERRYGANAWVSPEYRKRTGDLVNSICRQYKLGKRYVDPLSNEDEISARPRQIELQPWLPFAPDGQSSRSSLSPSEIE